MWMDVRGVSAIRALIDLSQFMDNRAIRTADWSLVEVDGAGWELFRVATDPFENDNLVGTNPHMVTTLERSWLEWWREQSGEETYRPKLTKESGHYRPQGDRGSGVIYRPSAMPPTLADRYPVPPTKEATEAQERLSAAVTRLQEMRR